MSDKISDERVDLNAEHIYRVNLMSTGDSRWDLSENDIEALSAVLTLLNARNEQLIALRTASEGMEKALVFISEMDRSVDIAGNDTTLERVKDFAKSCLLAYRKAVGK